MSETNASQTEAAKKKNLPPWLQKGKDDKGKGDKPKGGDADKNLPPWLKKKGPAKKAKGK